MSVQNTLTQLQNNTNRVQFERGRENLGNETIGQDGFFQLMMAQLLHQDPLNPVDNSEFVSQQAQFAQVEKLDQLNQTMLKSMQVNQASTWIGKNVEYTLPDGNGETLTGTVSSVSIGDSIALEVNGELIPPDNVSKIMSTASP